QDLGAPLATAPRTAGLPELVLRDARPTDGTRDTVLLNAASKRAWLRVDGGGRARPEPQWFGPFDLTKPPVAPPDRPNVQPFPAGLSVDRFGQIGRAARDEIRGGRLAFDDAGLPVGPRLAELGVLHADRRTGAAFRVFLVDDGRAADTLDRYYVRREIAGEPSRVAGPVVVPPFVDPYGDGQLTFPGRAKNLYYRLAFDEHLAWRDGAPDREIHLARGTRVTDVDPYFVIPRNPDGSDADPDGATQVYFRHRPTGKWSGPHEL
ncbi:hypothetical protein L6R52_43635, partial [Myxococcota bacterium]|nr:hypothetical protein [Myxococcota bacterium]